MLCLHAMMTDGRYFGAARSDPERSFAAALAGAGFDVYVANFRGHGGRTATAARGLDWSFDDLVELDLPAMVAAIGCGEPLIIVGHSLGGLVASAAIASARIAPPRLLALPATAPWLLGSRGPLRRRAAMALYRHVTAWVGYAPIRALGIGTADEAPTYVEQLTGWARSGRWTSLRGLDYLASLAAIDIPVWPIAGAGDWMCTPDDAERFSRSIASALPVRVVGKRAGDPIDPGHFELFTRGALAWWRELVVQSEAVG